MNLNSNGARSVAALVVLNAGLFLSHHAPIVFAHRPAVQAQTMATRAQICAAQVQAKAAAAEARAQARVAAREMTRAQKQLQRDAWHAAIMAPTPSSCRSRTSLTDYVRSLGSYGSRSVTGGI